MSHVTAAPNVLAASAGELAAIGSTMRAANAAAAAPTAGVLAAGGDDVSAGIAALFGARAQAYQAISAQAALFHDRFVQILQEGAAAYAMAEAANALPLQKAQGVVSELAQDRTGGTGTGQSRGAGGFGGVGQAGGKGWDGGPIGNGQVGEQHGPASSAAPTVTPEWLAPRTAAAFLLRTAAAQQVPPVSRTRVAVVLGSVAQPAMGLGPAAQTQSVVPGLAGTSSGLFAGTAESAWPAVTAV
ncbi:PE-PGRS family protein PE_PGRS39 [Mycobacterium tuberculosis]|nr:PE-PGRS family protein PE_PGRS39 [Mycobacterium tuberculosis]